MKNTINGQPIEFGNPEHIKFVKDAERQIAEDKEAKIMRKNMNPLEKFIDSHANIGWSHFAIGNLKKIVSEKLKTKSPIDEMVVKATGYDKAVIKAFLINLRGHYKELVKNHRYVDETEQAEIYKVKIADIDKALKGILKNVKEVSL